MRILDCKCALGHLFGLITRHEQNLNFRMKVLKAAKKLGTSHSRHHYIQQGEMDRTVPLLTFAQCGWAVRSFNDDVAAARKSKSDYL